ncbi:Imm63 family immunity protein [Pseudomonas sp. 39167]|uniref:Imm63 family immunity protein n=1 Tax=Pseudomonas sp. 39167 TaxID=2967215 RepID=UPI0023638344|nr:Imm63 family immunity protein [Pseudomonas sp. 39167]MDD2029993.1 immunity 63 family protein [Pseudomonas sp. 39167]
MSSIAEIQEAVYSLGEQIGAPRSLLVVKESSPEDGSPHVEVKSNEYSYVCSERCFEIYRKRTTSLDDLLYWIISAVAFKLASDFEVANRIADADSRRLLFSKYISILGLISEEWHKKASDEVESILTKAPYSDSSAES